jgi:hypothetical protein
MKDAMEAMTQAHDLRDRLLPILECEDPRVAINVLVGLVVHVIVFEVGPEEWRNEAKRCADTIQEMVAVEQEARP